MREGAKIKQNNSFTAKLAPDWPKRAPSEGGQKSKMVNMTLEGPLMLHKFG